MSVPPIPRESTLGARGRIKMTTCLASADSSFAAAIVRASCTGLRYGRAGVAPRQSHPHPGFALAPARRGRAALGGRWRRFCGIYFSRAVAAAQPLWPPRARASWPNFGTAHAVRPAEIFLPCCDDGSSEHNRRVSIFQRAYAASGIRAACGSFAHLACGVPGSCGENCAAATRGALRFRVYYS